jgi:hypothetical protein
MPVPEELMTNWISYEDHPLIYRRSADYRITEMWNPTTREWFSGPETGDTLQRKLVYTGDAVEVPYERIAHVVDSK